MTRYSSEVRKERLPDQKRIQEMEYFQSIYPQSIKQLQRYVSEECDRMDYKGSPMYDEYPDMLAIEQACRRICSRIPELGESGDGEESGGGWEEMDAEPVEIYEIAPSRPPQSPPPWGTPGRPPQSPPSWGTPGRPPQDPLPWGPPGRPPQEPPGRPPQGSPGRPPQGSPPWGPPPRPSRGSTWMEDIVRVLLGNEMQNRRCRTGLC